MWATTEYWEDDSAFRTLLIGCNIFRQCLRLPDSLPPHSSPMHSGATKTSRGSGHLQNFNMLTPICSFYASFPRHPFIRSSIRSSAHPRPEVGKTKINHRLTVSGEVVTSTPDVEECPTIRVLARTRGFIRHPSRHDPERQRTEHAGTHTHPPPPP